jgi:GntR family transcriptional regulator, transcriptional repressor for pyruvate dehydrogenase complex
MGGSHVDQTEQALLALVEERGLRAGERLPPERALVATLGASRAVVREAIGRLAAGGVLESRRGSGTYVASADIAAITEVRLLLEPDAAARAARARSWTQLAALRRTVDELGRAVDRAERFAALDTRVHTLVAEACGNDVMRDLLERLARPAALARAVTSGDRGVRAATLRDLTDLVAAIESGEPEAARAAMRRHLERLAGYGNPEPAGGLPAP